MSRHKSLERFCSVVALCLLLSGCKTVKVVEQVPVYIHDTTQTVREVHDSTFIDRWHTVYQKGDTIFVTDEVTKIVTKIKIDTAYKYIEKPVVISKTETVEVEKPLTWWQKTKQKGFWFLSAVVLVYVIWKTKKWWLPLLK
jgi:hypothetical protein